MRCKGPRGDLLSKIHALLKKDYELARFVLGPAVLHLICSGNEDDIGFVSNELKSVLNHALDSGACDEGEVGQEGADPARTSLRRRCLKMAMKGGKSY